MSCIQIFSPSISIAPFYLQPLSTPTYNDLDSLNQIKQLPANMDVSFFEESPRLKFNQVLRQVQSIHTVTEELVNELQTTLGEGKYTVDRFKVRPPEWHDWTKANPHLREAVEYDSAKQYIIIKGKPGPLHDAVTTTFEEFFDDLHDLMHGLSRHQSTNTMTTTKAKKPTTSSSSTTNPFVALEIGIGESTPKLLETAKHLLTRPANKKNVVIVIDIQERRPPPIRSFKQFDLSADDIKSLDVEQISQAIIRWYQRNKNPLVGDFMVGVYFCYADADVVQVYKGDILLPSSSSSSSSGNKDGKYATSVTTSIPYGRLMPSLQRKREYAFPVPVNEVLAALQKTVTLVLPHHRAQKKALELTKRMSKRRVSK